MAKFNEDVAKTCNYKVVAASQTTSPISRPGDGIVGKDYLERVVITAASSLGGAVTVFDGTTTLVTHIAQLTGYLGDNVWVYELGVLCDSTKGFNITTGASVSCLAVGRF
jgi:hypothetical protein